jgi:hypothetical protein
VLLPAVAYGRYSLLDLRQDGRVIYRGGDLVGLTIGDAAHGAAQYLA